jgi:MYXO-CTERM domain-containing protein
LSLGDAQELLVYVLHPDQRYEPKNYEVVYPPTDLHVDPKVEEKMGEFYVALYDRMMKRHPLAFVEEYAWSADKCGQPCATEPLLLSEVLSLGGDVFELSVPDEEKQPEPPALTDEEKKKQEEDLKPLKPAERVKAKKELEEERKELYRRKALIARHHYTLSRFHRRYDAKGLPKDPTIGPGSPVRGGADIPQGPNGECPTDVRPAQENMFQARYITFHPWKGVINCEKPERWRWAKKWRTVFKRNKIWIADDLARRNRTLINVDKVVWTPVPALGIKGTPPKAIAQAGADAGPGTDTKPEAKRSSCGCRFVNPESSGTLALGGLALLVLALRRRRGSAG